MTDSTTYLTTLAGIAATQSFMHSSLARQRATWAFVDTFGCIVAGLDQSASRCARQAFSPLSREGSMVFPSGRHRPELAALLNATSAHALDFDDHEPVGITHPSAVFVPALLALGEQRRAPGAALIDGYIAGYEILSRIGELANPQHYLLGWHATSTIAALGAAAACSRLLGHDQRQTCHSISLSCSFAGGFRSQFGTMAKPLHAGLAAQAGVMSALLADAGMTGSDEVLDGDFGFFQLMGTEPIATVRSTGDGIALESNGPIIKRFPSCAATHRSLDSVLQLMEDENLGACDILSVSTEIPSAAASALVPGYPTDEMQAHFSMAYCLAVAVETGGLNLSDFQIGAVERPSIRERAENIELDTYTSSGNPFANENYRVRTTLVTCDDRQFEEVQDYSCGSPQDPLSLEDLQNKFESCLFNVSNPTETQMLFHHILDFENIPDVALLMKLAENAVTNTVL